MQLHDDQLEAWGDLLVATGEKGPASKIAEEVREEVAAGSRELRHTRVHSDGDAGFLAGIRVAQIHEHTWFLTGLRVHPGLDEATSSETASLIPEALKIAREEGATQITSYAPVTWLFEDYERALSDAGLLCKGERVEFAGPVENLPGEDDTPFRWEAMQPETRPLAEQMIALATVGDPETEEPVVPQDYLAELLGEAGLNCDDDCVHVGYLDQEPVGIVVAQVMPSTGWSRIAYMGLIPGLRGNNLGRFVHAHGFAMMKAQGGKIYEGGTSVENTAMLALFRRAGITETGHFEVWRD